MAFSIPDTFDNETKFTNYDSLLHGSVSDLNTILANDHVDIRQFLQTAIFQQRTQDQIDSTQQSNVLLDTDQQTSLEQVIKVPGEAWSCLAGQTGTNGVVLVGPVTSFFNWPGLQLTMNGAALSATLSSVQGSAGAVSIAGYDVVSIVINLPTGTLAAPVITFTSDTNGAFGTGHDSAAVTLSAGSGKEWKANVSAFANAGFDNTQITAVKVALSTSVNPTNGSVLTMFGFRAYKTGYVPYTLDFQTRRGCLVLPPTFDLNASTHITPTLVRGVPGGSGADPRGQSGSLQMKVGVGLLGISTGGSRNVIDLIFREDISDGRYSKVSFSFYGTDCSISGSRTDSNGTVTAFPTQSVGNAIWGPLVTNNTHFIFEIVFTGSVITINIYQSNTNEQQGTRVYTYTYTSSVYQQEPGRVGYGATIKDGDLRLADFEGTITSIATLTSKVYASLTPVEGVILSASFAEDTNLFTSFIGAVQDAQKTVDGSQFSWRGNGPMVTNPFRILDFNQAYIDFDIWVPDGYNDTNKPNVVIRSPSLTSAVTFPALDLQINQWNSVHIDFTSASEQINSDVTYYLYLEQSLGQGTSYEFWVANMEIRRRNVAWRARARSDRNFREFRDMVNDPFGGLHFLRSPDLAYDERGQQLQIQAEALTEDAWVSSFTAQPVYAQLGKPTYYP